MFLAQKTGEGGGSTGAPPVGSTQPAYISSRTGKWLRKHWKYRWATIIQSDLDEISRKKYIKIIESIANLYHIMNSKLRKSKHKK